MLGRVSLAPVPGSKRVFNVRVHASALWASVCLLMSYFSILPLYKGSCVCVCAYVFVVCSLVFYSDPIPPIPSRIWSLSQLELVAHIIPLNNMGWNTCIVVACALNLGSRFIKCRY